MYICKYKIHIHTYNIYIYIYIYTYTGLCVTGHKGSGDIHASIWEPTTGRIIQRLNCGPVNGASGILYVYIIYIYI
jgi:hypothetical protein